MNIHGKISTVLGLLLILAGLAATGTTWAYDRSSNKGNGVRITVKPTTLALNQAATFDVQLNTHSVDLSQDLAVVSELKDDKGRSYRPDQWKGDPPGGHHRKGTLIFPVLEGPVQSVTLIIRDVANVPERVFTWKVKP